MSAEKVMFAAARIFARSVSCLAEIEALKLENAYRSSCGLAPAFSSDVFLTLEQKYRIDENTIQGDLNNANSY